MVWPGTANCSCSRTDCSVNASSMTDLKRKVESRKCPKLGIFLNPCPPKATERGQRTVALGAKRALAAATQLEQVVAVPEAVLLLLGLYMLVQARASIGRFKGILWPYLEWRANDSTWDHMGP